MGGFGRGGWFFCSYVVTVLRPQISSPKQRGLVGWANRWEGVEDTSGWAGGCSFPFPPSQDPFMGLRCCGGLFVFLMAGLSFSEKIQPGVKRTQKEKGVISTGRVKTSPRAISRRPRTQRHSAERGCRINPSPLRFPGPPVLGKNVTVQATEHPNLPLNEPQNGGRPLGRSLLYPAAAQRTLT